MLPNIYWAGLSRGVLPKTNYPSMESIIGGHSMFVDVHGISGIPKGSADNTLIGRVEPRTGARSMSPTLLMSHSSGINAFTASSTPSLEKWKSFQLIVRSNYNYM